MQRGQPLRARVSDLEKVVQVGAAVGRAGRTVAACLEWLVVGAVAGVEDMQRAKEARSRPRPALRIARAECVETAMPRVAGGQRAVEQRVAQGEGADQVVRPADPQGVLGCRRRQRVDHPAQRVGEQGAIGRERPSAKTVPVESNARQLGRALAPQSLDAAALHHREHLGRRLIVPQLASQAIELVARSARPGDGALHAARLLVVGGLRIGAVVEADNHVGSQLELQLDHAFGSEDPLLAGRGLAEDHLAVPDHAARGVLADHRPDLESS